jgi:predicted MPP superfamily phosphohydrolase
MPTRPPIFFRGLCALATCVLLLGSANCGAGLPGGPVEILEPTGSSGPIPLPNLDDSLKFAVLGDFGNGSTGQYQLADQMAETHTTFPFEMVILTGDNIYGPERPQDFVARFERPYKALLDRGVKFYASLGNHDSREQRSYEPFNMGGELYYSLKAPKQNVRFFALESTYPEPDQIAWLEKELAGSGDDWKIAFFHHPLYSSASRHGSDIRLRETLEPLFVKYNISVVFTGHDHVYERIEPQQGISHFVVGSGGQLRRGDLAGASAIRARGFDRDLAFVAAEVNGDLLTFNAISRLGQIVDSGVIKRRIQPTSGGGGR